MLEIDPVDRAAAPRAAALLRPVLACAVLAMCVAPLAAWAAEPTASPAGLERAATGGRLLALNDKPAPAPLGAPGDEAARRRLVPGDTDSQGATPDVGDDDWLDDGFSLESEFDALTNDDPLEPMNRGVFAFNRQVERFALTPITNVYQALVPTPGREGVNNVFLNLDAPVRMTNALLQGRPRASGIALGRFVLNTTFGLGGLFDVGSRVGLRRQQADFGQTLATWGTPQGPFFVFPFLGPMTLRHGFGMGVDFMMQPVSYVVGPLPGMIVGAGKDFSRREQVEGELETLRDTSLDFYASLRSAFLQDRADIVAAGAMDSHIEEVADSGRESLSPEEREARCLAHPRARRELRKPGLRGYTVQRCAAPAI